MRKGKFILTSFKISKGLEQNLPEEKIDGTMYFCTDTGNIYVDYSDNSGTYRKLVNLKAINDECTAALNSSKNYADSAANNALTQSKNYTDNKLLVQMITWGVDD